MKSSFSSLGLYIEEYDELNKNGEFDSLEHLQGINSNKYFQECKSNKNEIDLLRYRICRHGMFAYNKATSRNGERISIAYREGDDCLVSPSYQCFKVKDENVLNPRYLMLWFNRPIFDKYARFHSWGSATEFFTWETMKEVQIIIPDIETQKKIVKDAALLDKNISILNQKINALDDAMSILYKEEFSNTKNGIIGNFGTLGEIVSGATPYTEIKEYYCKNGIVWITPKDLTSTGLRFIEEGENNITEAGYKSCSTKLVPEGTVLITSRAPVGVVALAKRELCTNQGFKSLIPNKGYKTAFIYWFVKNNISVLTNNASGTTFDEISGTTMKKVSVMIPKPEDTEHFNSVCSALLKEQMLLEEELLSLIKIKRLLIDSI